MRYKYLAILLLMLPLSCKDKSGNDTSGLRPALEKAKNLKCEPIDVGDELIGRPRSLEIADNYLLFIDAEVEDKVVVFYDLANKKIAQRLFYVGQGPDDLITPVDIGVNRRDKSVGLFQRNSGIYREYNLDELLKGNIALVRQHFFPSTDRLTKYPDGYIAQGHYENGSIAIHDKDGNQKSVNNIYPDYFSASTNINNKYIYGQGSIDYIKDNVLAFASFYTGEIRFYHIDNAHSLTPAKSYYTGKATDNIKNGIQGIEPVWSTTNVHFTNIYATDKYVYMLYSGETMATRLDAKHSFVLKFDKDGNFVECYKTNYLLFDEICVSADDSALYGISKSYELGYFFVKALL